MFKWLRRFFYSDDPIVKVAAGFSEPEALMYRELLQNNGIIAMKKNMEAVYDQYWRPMLPSANDFALFVKQSDPERAREMLAPMLEPEQLVDQDAGEGR